MAKERKEDVPTSVRLFREDVRELERRGYPKSYLRTLLGAWLSGRSLMMPDDVWDKMRDMVIDHKHIWNIIRRALGLPER